MSTTQPLSIPSESRIKNSNFKKYYEFLKSEYHLSFTGYNELHTWSVTDIETFWESIWKFSEIIHSKTYKKMQDVGLHVVCVQMTAEFLDFARSRGNDLITPVPAFGFPGLIPGDSWWVCAGTWREAFEAGVAAPVVLAATHEETLAVVPLDALKAHALEIH